MLILTGIWAAAFGIGWLFWPSKEAAQWFGVPAALLVLGMIWAIRQARSWCYGLAHLSEWRREGWPSTHGAIRTNAPSSSPCSVKKKSSF
ncbi:hypothetical protein [Deinococcus hopiensis]|nr:hypothetical protein [Deinococcus hopiensis]